jgi:hypothetical protein
MDEHFPSHLVESFSEVFYKVRHNHLESKIKMQIGYSSSTLWHVDRFDRWVTKEGNIFLANLLEAKP